MRTRHNTRLVVTRKSQLVFGRTCGNVADNSILSITSIVKFYSVRRRIVFDIKTLGRFKTQFSIFVHTNLVIAYIKPDLPRTLQPYRTSSLCSLVEMDARQPFRLGIALNKNGFVYYCCFVGAVHLSGHAMYIETDRSAYTCPFTRLNIHADSNAMRQFREFQFGTSVVLLSIQQNYPRVATPPRLRSVPSSVARERSVFGANQLVVSEYRSDAVESAFLRLLDE